MKKIMVSFLFIMTCSSPQPLMQSGSPDVRKVSNHIKVEGNANDITFNYYRIYGATEYEMDSLKNILNKQKTDSL